MSAILPQYKRLPAWSRDPLNHLFIASIAVIMASGAVINHGLSLQARTDIQFNQQVVPERNPLFTGEIYNFFPSIISTVEAAFHEATETRVEDQLLAPPLPTRRVDLLVPAKVERKKASRRRRSRR
jgi:hypothetical protein